MQQHVGAITVTASAPDQARVVSAVMASEAGADFTLYAVEVTPSDGGAPWTVQHRFRLASPPLHVPSPL